MKKRKTQSQNHGTGQPIKQADFYTVARREKPLFSDRTNEDPVASRKAIRHEKGPGRAVERDPRERVALIAVIKAAITLLFLFILFFMLWKGIKLYEESIWMENQPAQEVSPVMNEVALVDEFDISAQNAKESFSERLEVWSETERLLRSVGELLLRNNVDDAIDRCQQILRMDPAHIGALQYLGELYFQKSMFVEAVNTYIRLLSVDPSRNDFQLALLKSLDAYGDAESTISVAQWYQSKNIYNEDVQRYLANAYYSQEKYVEAAAAYERVLKDSPRDIVVLEALSIAYMRLEQFDKALTVLKKLVSIEYRDPLFYRRLAYCHAQLGQGTETVQVLGKSAHLFGADTVAMWMQDPLMDPIRRNRDFQLFADTVMTEEYRKYLEQMAQAMDRKDEPTIETGLLDTPAEKSIDSQRLIPQN